MADKTISRLAEITGSGPLKKRMSLAAALLRKTLDASCCYIYRWNAASKRLTILAASGKGTPALKQSGGNGKTILLRLEDASRRYGLISIEPKGRTPIPKKARKVLDIAAYRITEALRYDSLASELKDAKRRIKNLETKLMEDEKLVSLGELSASLAHEMKNPLSSIGGLAARLEKKIGAGSPERPYVELIAKEAKRLEALTLDVLKFTGTNHPELSAVELNSLVKDTVTCFAETCETCRIELSKTPSSRPLLVMADPFQLKTALDNVITNAIQSMEKMCGRKNAACVITVATKKSGNWGVVEVSDTGGGIDPAILDRVFNPFFTTKEAGTGLGLCITSRIVERHGGAIDVANDFGKGLTLALKFRLAGHNP